jgi:hypothetical protein
VFAICLTRSRTPTRDVRYERRKEPTRTEIVDREKDAIAQRLIRVCHEMPPHEFEVLVARMAEIEIKYRLRRVYPLGCPPGALPTTETS